MMLWIINQILTLRQAVTGRTRPSELAGGLALGVAIGLIPMGNLVSLLVIGVLVSLRVNHALAALAAVGVSFLAVGFDPWTHQLGAALLESDRVRALMQRIWDWPLMPWTDLNNTVVMGSTVAAAIALLPTYALSMPVFRWFAPRARATDEAPVPPPSDALSVAFDGSRQSHPDQIPPLVVIEQPLLSAGGGDEAEPPVHVETQIDVIRMSTKRESEDLPTNAPSESFSGGQMNEALGYLLRRLRDSRQGKAA